MRVVHRVSISSSPEVSAELAYLGVEVGSAGFVSFEVDETHPRWAELRAWIARRSAPDVLTTAFSGDEVTAAPWLELVPDWHHGYPQPDEDSFGYLSATYDLTEYCEKCGVGLRQVAPFQMKGEPKWGRRGVLQLNWVFDEFFVAPHVWSAVFEPLGVGCRRVMTPRGDELETVVQLVIEAEADIGTDGLEAETCGSCGRTKYVPVARGRFPALVSEPAGALVKTRQWFGSGASAHHRVLVAQDARRALDAEKVRGASFRPVAGVRLAGARPA